MPPGVPPAEGVSESSVNPPGVANPLVAPAVVYPLLAPDARAVEGEDINDADVHSVAPVATCASPALCCCGCCCGGGGGGGGGRGGAILARPRFLGKADAGRDAVRDAARDVARVPEAVRARGMTPEGGGGGSGVPLSLRSPVQPTQVAFAAARPQVAPPASPPPPPPPGTPGAPELGVPMASTREIPSSSSTFTRGGRHGG